MHPYRRGMQVHNVARITRGSSKMWYKCLYGYGYQRWTTFKWGWWYVILFHFQGTSRTPMIVKHCHKQSTTGKFLSLCIEDFRDGPSSNGGGGMLSLFHFQVTSHTAMIVKHCHKQSTTGKFLSLCIEDFVMEVGMYGSLWTNNFSRFSNYVSDHSLIFHACE